MTLRASRAILLAALAASVLSCGGGGGGGGTPPPTQPVPGITFTAQGVGAPAIRLARGAGSTTTVLLLQVQADQLPPIYGVAFDLGFPANLVRFDAVSEGDFLTRNAPSGTSLQVVENPAGNLVIGYTRLGAAGMVGGSGELFTLRFVAIGGGAGAVTFSRNRVLDESGNPIAGPAWGGGTLQVTQ